MTVKVELAPDANLYDLTKSGFSETFKSGQSGLYFIPQLSKLGELVEGIVGKTPHEAFHDRYNGQKSSMDKDLICTDMFIIDNVSKGIDDQIRKEIADSHKSNVCPFDANYRGYQQPGNSEALIGFKPEEHMGELERQIKYALKLSVRADTRVDFTPRFAQPEVIDSVESVFENNDTCLLAAHTGMGKTLMSVVSALRVVASGVVLVTTPMTDTISSFIGDINSKSKFLGSDREVKYSAVNKQDFTPSLVDSMGEKEVLFVVLSVQDLFYDAKNNKGSLRPQYKSIIGKVRMWIQDERHTYYDGTETSKVVDIIKPEKTLQLTATPYGITDNLSDDQIVFKGILWALKNKDKTKVPNIGIEILSAKFESLSSEYSDLYSTEEGFHPDKFFHPDQGLSSQCRKLFFDFYGHCGNRGKKRSPLSISGDSGLCDFSKEVGLAVLPVGDKENSAEEYINKLATLLNDSKTGDRKYISSYQLEYIVKKEKRSINDVIDSYLSQEYTGVTILTCRKYLTGTNIKRLGHVILMTKIGSPQLFEQLMGRLVRVFKGKDNVKMYCLAPKNDLVDCVRDMAVRTSVLGGGQVKELLDCLSLSQYNGLNFESLQTEEVLSSMHRSLKGNNLRNTIIGAVSGGGISHWEGTGVDKDSNFKNRQNKTQLTEDTGAKVADITRQNNNQNKTKQEVDLEQRVVNCISSIIDELSMLSHIHQSDKIEEVLSAPQLDILFPNYIDAARKTILESNSLRNTLSTYLASANKTASNILEDHDSIFVNTKAKQNDLSLVFLPATLSRVLVESVRECYNSGDRTFLVPNALSGILPLMLQQEYPDADIRCLEYTDMFIDHLRSLGFVTYRFTDTNNMKFEVIIGNPPYQSNKQNGAVAGSGSSALFLDFIAKSIELVKEGGIVSLVTPTNAVTGSADKTKYLVGKDAPLAVNLVDFNVNHLFNVGQRVCRWRAIKTSNDTVANINDGRKINLREVDYLVEDNVLASIVDTLQNHPGPRITLGNKGGYNYRVAESKLKKMGAANWADLSRVRNITPSKETPYLIDFNGKDFYVAAKPDSYDSPRLFVPQLTNPKKFRFYTATNKGANGSTYTVEFDTIEQADKVANILNNPYYLWIVAKMRIDGRIRKTHLETFPIVNIEEVLSEEQKEYIRTNPI